MIVVVLLVVVVLIHRAISYCSLTWSHDVLFPYMVQHGVYWGAGFSNADSHHWELSREMAQRFLDGRTLFYYVDAKALFLNRHSIYTANVVVFLKM